jgi:histidinol-phosphate aminotransferase
MICPKPHLRDVYRTPLERIDRTKFLRLDKNEAIDGIPDAVLQEIMSELTPDFVSTYPPVYRLYESLSKYLSIGEDHLLLTAGSDAAIKAAFEVFVEPKDEVVCPDPTYAMYPVYCKLFRAELKTVPYGHDLLLPIERMLTQITPRTKLIILANPNSPTGTVVGREDIIRILRKAGHVGVAVLVDEAYYPFYPKTVIDLIDAFPNLIVTRTFSKAFCLASTRLGFVAAHPETIKYLRKFKPIYEVNAFAVLFGCAMLRHTDLVEGKVRELMRGKKHIEREMRRLGLKTYPTYTNFINIEVGEKNVQPLVDHMRKAAILIKGGSVHETLRRCIRVTLGPVPQMKTVVRAIEDYMEKARKKR